MRVGLTRINWRVFRRYYLVGFFLRDKKMPQNQFIKDRTKKEIWPIVGRSTGYCLLVLLRVARTGSVICLSLVALMESGRLQFKGIS